MSQASLSDENSRTFSLQTKVWPTYCHHCKGGDFSSFLEKIQNMYTFSVNKSSRTSRRQVSSNIICWHDLVSTTSRLDPTRPNLNCITRYSTLACCPTIFPLQSVRLNFCQSWWLVVSPQWKTNPVEIESPTFLPTSMNQFWRIPLLNCFLTNVTTLGHYIGPRNSWKKKSIL